MSRLDRIEAEHGYAASHPELPTLLASALHAEHDAIPGLLAIARAAETLTNGTPQIPGRSYWKDLCWALADFEAGQ